MYLPRSHPAADLQFYLNGNRVKDDSLGATEISRESDGLLESSYRWVQGHRLQVNRCTGVQVHNRFTGAVVHYVDTNFMSLHVTRRLSLVVRPSHAMSGQLEVRMISIIKYLQYLCDTYA